MEGLVADIRQALRGLSRSLGYAIAAVAILAIGLAANTAVFSVADAVLFQPLTYFRPQELVELSEVIPQYSRLYPRIQVSARHYFEWRQRCRSFADLAIMGDTGSINLSR
jgi:hypothetical protein